MKLVIYDIFHCHMIEDAYSQSHKLIGTVVLLEEF